MTRDDLIYRLGKVLKETMAIPPKVHCGSCDSAFSVRIENPLAETLIHEMERYGLRIEEA